MQIEDSFLTLLTPEGEFLRARRQDGAYMIGEEILFYPIVDNKKNSSFIHRFNQSFRMKPLWIASFLLVIILGSLFPVYKNDKAYAYMSIDVNPSIELGVNDKMQVIELTGFNEEGKKIISRLSKWKKQDAAELMKSLLAEMKKAGTLKENKHVIFSTVRTKERKNDVEEKLQQDIKEIKETIHSQQLDLTVLSGTKKVLKKAHKQGITAGKYQSNKQNIKTTNENPKKENNNTPQSNTPVDIIKNQSQKQDGKIKNYQLEKQNQNDGKKIPPGQSKKLERNPKVNVGQQKKAINQERPMKKDQVSSLKKNVKNSNSNHIKENQNKQINKVRQNNTKGRVKQNNSQQSNHFKNNGKQQSHFQNNRSKENIKQNTHQRYKGTQNPQHKK
ncbi:anti-sigma factor domain-containing protein [Neobacillus mesonae]|uniref:anti-sigma factor domain-containing protein n=1 Tax=Neobacillus mesonae TaxID=1193713 RepID=UPI00255957F1|nr:anti-sigma factor domain-containing protein [Neobacillus mesonae]